MEDENKLDHKSNSSVAVAEPPQDVSNENINQSVSIKEFPEVKVAGGRFYCFIKRTFDIISSGLFLLILGWFILLLMFIKFCEDGHNPIYTSIRIGKNGKPFKFHKIRSMCPNAEAMKEELIAKGLNEADFPAFKMKNDPRITKFGRFLRKTSLDELPQIVSVFFGSLSVIGPRSPIGEEVEKYNEYERHRLDVKGGLLCSWQITKNRNKLTFEEWVKLDIDYIENRSIALDAKILFKAIWFVLTDRTGE